MARSAFVAQVRSVASSFGVFSQNEKKLPTPHLGTGISVVFV